MNTDGMFRNGAWHARENVEAEVFPLAMRVSSFQVAVNTTLSPVSGRNTEAQPGRVRLSRKRGLVLCEA